MNAIIKFLLQSGQPAGTSKTYIYTLEKATTKADLKPDSCWDLKALQAEAAQVSQPLQLMSTRRPGRPGRLTFLDAITEAGSMTFRERLQAWRYNLVPDHVVGEILTKRWTDNAIPFLALVVTVATFGTAHPRLLQADVAAGIRRASSASSRSSSPA